MNDRELLEKAAKAAGLTIETKPWCKAIERDGLILLNDRGGHSFWNPLTDDGDALRLAVKLGVYFTPEFSHFLSLERFSGQDRDDCCAHRRAIVRAAAEIGRTAA